MTLLVLGIALCVIGALTEIDGIRKLNRATETFHRASETYNRASESFNRATAVRREHLQQALRQKDGGVA